MTDTQPEQQSQEVTASELRGRTFGALCSDYEDYFDSISDLLEELVPHVEELDGSALEISRVFGSTVELTGEDRKAVVSFFRDLPDESISIGEMMGILLDEHFDTSWGRFLLNALHKHATYAPKLPILTNSLITSIIGGFEVVLAKVTAEYYRASPEALLATAKDKQKEFSLQDLQELESLEEAVEAAIASRVDDLLFGSLGNWKKFYKDKMHIDFTALVIDWPAIEELFQRRHIIVHNGGRASTRYIKSTGRADLSRDDVLTSDDKYVRMAIDQLFVLGYLVAASVWEKFTDEPGDSCADVHQMGYVLLTRRRWKAARQMSLFGVEHAKQNLTMTMCQVNVWIAEKAMHGTSAIARQVEEWDVSALTRDFHLAKYSLLDDMDRVYEMLPALLEAHVIDGSSLLDWPLLEGVRADPRFINLKAYVAETLNDEVQHVYQLPGGQVYHLPTCQRRGAGAELVREIDAVKSGARPCKSCHSGVKAD